MPNRRNHQKVGTIAGAILLAAWDIIDQKREISEKPEQKFDYERLFKKTAIGAGGGFVLSTLADTLEPATHSHHRCFFHSATALGLTGVAAYKLNKSDLPKEIKQVGTALATGYASHIFLDSATPRSVPFLSRKTF